VFCSQHIEDSGHLFLTCQFSKGVWNEIANWVGKNINTGTALWNHFLLFGNMVRLKKSGRVNRLIWLVTMWNIWKHRNNVIFNGAIPDAITLLNEIIGRDATTLLCVFNFLYTFYIVYLFIYVP
jgi:hypothetical protein